VAPLTLLQERLGAAALLAFLAAPALAATPPLLSGQTSFSFADCSNAGILLRFTADPAPLSLRAGDIVLIQSAAGVAGTPVDWTILWEAPTLSDPAIHEYESIGSVKNGCPPPGRYKVPLTLYQPAGDQVSKTAFEITVERTIEPVLDLPATAALTLEIWPLGAGRMGALPGLSLGELSGSADLGQVFATSASLKNAAGDLTDIRLEPAGPVTLAAGKSATLDLLLSRTPDPGTYTARLPLHAFAAKQSQAVDITLKVRVFWGFLLAAIGLGVALGWLFNVHLAQRAALGAAQLQGLRDAGAIASRALPQKDTAAQQRLIVLAAAVAAKVRNARAVTDVQAAVKDGQDMAASIETRAADTAKQFAEAMTRLQGWWTPDGAALDEALEGRLLPLRQTLDTIERTGAAGDAEAALARVAELEARIRKDVPRLLRAWLVDLNGALESFGPWGDGAQEPEATRHGLLTNLAAAYVQTDPAQLLRQSNAIARGLGGWVTLTAPGGMARSLRRAGEILRAGGQSALADALMTHATASQSLGADRQDLIGRIEALAATRREVEGMLRTARPGDAALDRILGGGDIEGAAKLMAPPPAAPHAFAAYAFPPVEPLTRPSAPLPAAEDPVTLPRIRLAPHLETRATVRIELDWSLASLAKSAPVWERDPAGAADFANGTAEGVDLTAQEPGFLTISAVFAGQSPVSVRTYIGEPVDSPDYRKTAAETQRVNNATAAVAAVVTVFFGYEIFIAGWFGTFADFFSAFLWGFFGQFGLERMRDLAKPMTSKVPS
jgi:hypothetical protein